MPEEGSWTLLRSFYTYPPTAGADSRNSASCSDWQPGPWRYADERYLNEAKGIPNVCRSGQGKWRIPGGKAAARLREFQMEPGLTTFPPAVQVGVLAAIQQKNE